MAPARKTPRLRHGGGAITWVGLLLLLGLAAAAYLAWVAIPVYVVRYEVQQVVRQTGYAASKDPDDGALLEAMTVKLRKLQEREEAGTDGRPVLRPVVDVRPADVTWVRSADGSLRIAFEYDHEFRLPFLERTMSRRMDVDLAMDVSRTGREASR